MERLSFDLPTIANTPGPFPEVVLVEMDEDSYGELRQPRGQPWDRSRHARLLDHLRADGAALVVLDMLLDDEGTNAAGNEQLAAALRAGGRVVLGAEITTVAKAGFHRRTVVAPLDPFREAVGTNHWGLVDMNPEWPPLAAIIRTACAPDPARRYANAQAMHEALKALDGGPGAAPRTHA